MLMPILQVHSEDMPEYAVVCGDPKRAERIAGKLDKARELAFSREYRTFVGEKDGIRIAVVSHGVGSPGAAVCFEELIRAGVKTLIRVGTAGSYSAELPPGSLVISTAAAREEGLTRQLVPRGFPAVADSEVVAALAAAAARVGAAEPAVGAAQTGAADSAAVPPGVAAGAAAAPAAASMRVRKGITLTLDVFFAGVEEIPHQKYKRAGVLAVEMEIASLYVVAALRGARAAAIVALDGYADADLAAEYDPHNDVVAAAVEREIDIALQAVVDLAAHG